MKKLIISHLLGSLRCFLLVGSTFWLSGGHIGAKERQGTTIVNTEITHTLETAKVLPAPLAPPEDLVRRIYLDLLGRIPTKEETVAFLEDSRTDRHHQLIDRLLQHPEMAFYWAGVLDRWLNPPIEEELPPARQEHLTYLFQALSENRPWDQISRELLDPDEGKTPGASYYLTSRLDGDRTAQLDSITVAVSSNFFGIQLACAKCHDHPFVTRWKQDHYYGLAAFFNTTVRGKKGNLNIVQDKPAKPLLFTGKRVGEKNASMLFLDNQQPKNPNTPNGRAELVQIAVSPENPFFRKSMVNKVWKQLFGIGLVEPVDQVHEENPATHPKLLEDLALHFSTSGFRIKDLIADMMHSEAYLRSSQWAGETRPKQELYPVSASKPLTENQFATSLSMVTGHYQAIAAKTKPVGNLDKTVAVRMQMERDRDYRKLVLRFQQDGSNFEATAAQALYLSYNETMQKWLRANRGNLLEQLKTIPENQKLVLDLYLHAYSRRPTPEETTLLVGLLSENKPNRETILTDILWAICSSSEFRFVR
ncbi:MAG: DUF1549 domain-containing protein [Zavarzinella sp.]